MARSFQYFAITCVGFIGLNLYHSAQAADLVLFSDSFESGLSQWVGKSGGSHSGQIITDPLNPINQVLNFTALTGGGDVFSSLPLLSDSGSYRLSFDYLGIAQPGSIAGDLGGFAGYSFGLPGSHTWLAGTSGASGVNPVLADDGTWNSYAFEFTTANAVRIMLEDFGGSEGVAGDAYFDNVRLEAVGVSANVPEPSSILAFGIFGGSLLTLRRKQR
ncbi:PEP-CTERM sorting domain-containing protein [Roseofilum casamattae]|uniref:PEP-CTERM sorting domain-containing protein n=1 Tax=Roseofilum casamattae BLCC-M143 TaxID=3022442 RepID=A0ABT7C2D5_9CYAN|nr:PEP-CTERM sorting domain-containing protein [Roseofilum casamattae]MDJ1185227.1 PEP-CTERM sorting domain-containing protein [Roseofilum casamattae BLCC-M143]